MSREVDQSFLALPRGSLADAALTRARELGVEHADFRIERIRNEELSIRDNELQGAEDAEEVGFAVRVIHDGTWGFAAGVDLNADTVAQATELAVLVARTSRALSTERVELVEEPVHQAQTWVSSYDVNPFDIPVADKISLLVHWTETLLSSTHVDHADAAVELALENKYYADTAGTETTQQRVRVHPQAKAVSVDPASGAFETMRTLAPPTGRGWEYLTGAG